MKMRYTIIIGLAACWMMVYSAVAQNRLKESLSFVPADSVVVWSGDRSDLKALALSVDNGLKGQAVTAGAEERKNFKDRFRQWQTETAPSLDFIGRCSAEGIDTVVAVAHACRLSGELFLQTGESRYMDLVERCAFNYLTSRTEASLPLSFEKRMAARALMDISGMMYATDEEGIFVNFFVNNTTHVKTSTLDFVIDQLTALPYGNRLKIRISGLKNGRTPLTVRFRMPDWALASAATAMRYHYCGEKQGLPDIYVNGRSENLPVVGGYVVVKRLWNNGDEIYLDFPVVPLHLQQKASGGATAVGGWQYGPLAYGCAEPFLLSHPVSVFSYEVLPMEEPNEWGHDVFGIQVTDGTSQKRQWLLEPMTDAGKHVEINETPCPCVAGTFSRK